MEPGMGQNVYAPVHGPVPIAIFRVNQTVMENPAEAMDVGGHVEHAKMEFPAF